MGLWQPVERAFLRTLLRFKTPPAGSKLQWGWWLPILNALLFCAIFGELSKGLQCRLIDICLAHCLLLYCLGIWHQACWLGIEAWRLPGCGTKPVLMIAACDLRALSSRQTLRLKQFHRCNCFDRLLSAILLGECTNRAQAVNGASKCIAKDVCVSFQLRRKPARIIAVATYC